jgi:hypothetical protein
MNFPLSENNNFTPMVRTSCKNCTFAIYDEDTQTGCLHDRIGKFQNSLDKNYVVEAHDFDKNFYVIDKFCNFYRDKESWNEGVADKEKVQNEAKLTFDVLINCDGIDKEYSKWISLFINAIDVYGGEKVNIHLYHANNLDRDGKKEVLRLHKLYKNSTLNIYFDVQALEHKIVSSSRKSYHLNISKLVRPDLNILDLINGEVNNNLKRLLVIKSGDCYIYSNLSYKIQTDGSKDVNDIKKKILDFSKPEYYFEI